MPRDTVGKISLDMFNQQFDDKHSADEQMREQLTDFEANIEEVVTQGKKSCYGDFFVVVITKKERIMKNVIRNYFFHRTTCPSPDWDQAVYHYSRKDDALIFQWVVPSKDTCETIRDNPLGMAEEERELRDFVLNFHDGSLMRIAKAFNSEEMDSPLIITP